MKFNCFLFLIKMNKTEIESRRAIFSGSRYSHEEHEAINRAIQNKNYNNKKLSLINFRILAQNAKSNNLSPTDPAYIEYLSKI